MDSRNRRKEELEFCWILLGMNLLQQRNPMNMQLKGQETFIWDGMSSCTIISIVKVVIFLHIEIYIKLGMPPRHRIKYFGVSTGFFTRLYMESILKICKI